MLDTLTPAERVALVLHDIFAIPAASGQRNCYYSGDLPLERDNVQIH